MLSFNKFVEIVGRLLIDNVSETNFTDGGDENLKRIYLIWKSFQTPISDSPVDSRPEHHNSVTIIEPELTSSEQNITTREQMTCEISEVDANTSNIIAVGPSCSVPLTTEVPEDTTASNIVPKPISSGIISSANQMPEANLISSCIPEPIPSCSTQDNIYHSSPLKSQDGNSKIPTLSPFLHWPNSPKRKNKRQIERTPYAVTSEKYKKMCEAKRALEFEKEKQKEEKKRKREEKKQEQLEKKVENRKKDEQKENLKTVCGKCSKLIRKNGLFCTGCSKNFHGSCVPLTHKENIPYDGDDYLCHLCYKEDSEDNLSDGTTENGTESDVDELYALYQEERKKTGL